MAAEDAFRAAGPRRVDLIERLPDALLIFFSNVAAFIVDGDAIPRPQVIGKDADMSSGPRIINGVAQEIGHNRIDPFRVAIDVHLSWQLPIGSDALIGNGFGKTSLAFFGQGREVEDGLLQFEGARFQARQVEQVLDQFIHLLGFTADDGTVALLCRLVDVQGVQPFGVALDDSQRRLQLMGDSGQEGFAHMFHFLGLIELFLQFRIGLLQRRQCDIELMGQGIDAVAEFTNFIVEMPLPALGKIEMGHGHGQILQFQQGPGHALRQEKRTDKGQDQPEEAADDDEPLDDIDILPHGCDGLADDDIGAILDAVDEVEMLKIGHILIQLNLAQHVLIRYLAIEQIQELFYMQGHLEIVLHLSRLIFFPRDDDIMAGERRFIRRNKDPPPRPG